MNKHMHYRTSLENCRRMN